MGYCGIANNCNFFLRPGGSVLQDVLLSEGTFFWLEKIGWYIHYLSFAVFSVAPYPSYCGNCGLRAVCLMNGQIM